MQRYESVDDIDPEDDEPFRSDEVDCGADGPERRLADFCASSNCSLVC